MLFAGRTSTDPGGLGRRQPASVEFHVEAMDPARLPAENERLGARSSSAGMSWVRYLSMA